MIKIFKQSTNSATRAKWYRMSRNLGFRSTHQTCGFSDWDLRRNDDGDLEIVASTNYHSEHSLDEMYKHNFSNWK